MGNLLSLQDSVSFQPNDLELAVGYAAFLFQVFQFSTIMFQLCLFKTYNIPSVKPQQTQQKNPNTKRWFVLFRLQFWDVVIFQIFYRFCILNVFLFIKQQSTFAWNVIYDHMCAVEIVIVGPYCLIVQESRTLEIKLISSNFIEIVSAYLQTVYLCFHVPLVIHWLDLAGFFVMN